MPKLLKCARDPAQRQGERELARSEGCLAGATERLFVGQPKPAKHSDIQKFTPNNLAREITIGQIMVFMAPIHNNAKIIIKPYGSILAYSALK